MALIELTNKQKKTQNDSISRLNRLDEMSMKFDKRILILERESQIT